MSTWWWRSDGKETEDAVDRLVGVVGVQGAQAQVAGLGEGQGVRHGFGGAHLADENHVRCLAQGILQPHLEGLRIDTDLALRDQAARVIVEEFDRILDAEDMSLAVAIAVPDHRRQGR
jgi:hypothetical protein